MAVQLSERRDTRRLVTAVAAAILVHAGLFAAIPYLTSLDTSPMPDYGPVVVYLELPEATLETAPPVVEEAPRPEPSPAPAAKAAPAPAAKPAAKPATTASTATTAAAPARPAGTSAFRQSGATTGTSSGAAAASIVAAPPPVMLPAPGTGSEQRSGVGESITSHSAGGTIDLAKVDKSLASASTTGTATGTSGAAPASAGAKPGPAASIEWEDPTAAEGREYIIEPDVVLPNEAPDFLNEVRIAFAVNADGLVTSARVTRTSGSVAVDKACLDAMRKAKFTSSREAPVIKGTQVFTFVQKR